MSDAVSSDAAFDNAPVSEGDAADLVEHGPLIARFLVDLGEALDQRVVAGLAHPDPDLPIEGRALADRARRLGLTGAADHLDALAATLDAVRAAAPPGRIAPPPLTRPAVDATQRLVAWRRVFAHAFALQRVDGRLAAEALEARGLRPPRPPEAVATVRMVPIGLHLRGDRLTLHGLDLATGGRVTARDRLSDLDPLDPLGRPVISRLFQAAVSLRAVVSGLVDFSDHPVGRAHGGPLFAPAFRAVPTIVPLAPGLRAPTPPPVEARALDRLRRPVTVTVRVERRIDGVMVVDPERGEPIELEASDLLDLNLAKLLARAGCTSASLTVVLAPAAGPPRVIAALDPGAFDDDDARAWPAHDPLAFRFTGPALMRRVEAVTGDPVDTRWLCTLAALLTSDDDRLDGPLDDWRGPQPGLDAAFRAAVLRRLTATPPDAAAAAQAEVMLDDALLLAAMDPAQIAPGALAALLGRQPLRGEGVDGRALFRALWLGLDRGLLAERRGALLTVFAARYAGELGALEPHDIAARTIVLAELSREAAEADEANGEEPMSDDEILAPAREYLGAHLADLGGEAPLPSLMALHAYGTAYAIAHPDRDGMPLAPLMASQMAAGEAAGEAAGDGIAPVRLARAVADALLDIEGRPGRAGDALLVAAAAGLHGWFVA